MTYKAGSIREFLTWTKSVIKNPFTANETPQRWFDSDAMAVMAKLEAAGLTRVGKGFQADFWTKGPADPEGAVRTALVVEREER